MSSPGKNLRLGRIFRSDGNSLVVPMDHGMGDGPIKGIEKPEETLTKVIGGGADAVLTTFGVAAKFHDLLKRKVGLILRLDSGDTSSWKDPTTRKEWNRPYSVEDAVRMGADGVVVMGYIGTPSEGETLKNLALTAGECFQWGMPLLAEMLVFKSDQTPNPYAADAIALASRVGAEYGADFIKTYYSGDPSSFRRVAETCPVPVVVAGGEKMKTPQDVLRVTRGIMDGGGRGIAFGRNVWQHENPESMVRALAKIIHEDFSLEEAMKLI
jgi:fructose-bisphosphate aldolase/2-amino-3,7-dideoxy-D-threo-hept-6-ulosonate synthase